MIIHEGTAGQHIRQVIADAIAKAKRFDDAVMVHFNGTRLPVMASDNAEGRYVQWEAERETEAAAYRATPEYAEKQAEEARELARRQKRCNEILADLDFAMNCGGLQGIVAWAGYYADVADYRGVVSDHLTVLQRFHDAGYVANEFVGKGAEIKANRDVKGRYLIGQFMNGLERGEGFPGILISWLKRYAEGK